MSNDRVYCCNKEATCNNYERSELVFFEQVKFEKGFVLEKPRDFDPFGHAGFAHLWLQYD